MGSVPGEAGRSIFPGIHSFTLWSFRRREVMENEQGEPQAVSRSNPTKILHFCVFGLLGFGMVYVLNTGYFWSLEHTETSSGMYLFLRYLLISGLALGVYIICSYVSIPFLKRMSWLVYGLGVLVLGLVLIPGVGTESHGARRWIHIGGMGFQPSEVARLSIVMLIALWGSVYVNRLTSFVRGFLPLALLIFLPFLLILCQPDLGTALFLGGIAVITGMIAGIRWQHLLPAISLSAGGVLLILWFVFDHFRERLEIFWNPEATEASYQVKQSIVGLGAGGWTGEGLGEAVQKLHFLPQVQSDFIFPIIGEELGFIGVLTVLLLYTGILWAGTSIACRSPSRYGTIIAAGFTFCITFQAILNIGVATGVFPPTGIPLPLISYGGSSLVVTLAMCGFISAVSRTVPDANREEPEGVRSRS